MARKRVDTERRVQIVEALHKCLIVKSFNETSIKDIAAEAGVNHGVLHYYFSSKEEILLTYIDYIIDLYKEQYAQWLAERDGRISADRQFIIDIFTFMRERITLNKNLSKVFIEIWEIGSYNKKVRAKLQKAYGEWIQNVSEIIGKKISNKKTIDIMSRALVAYFEGMALFSIIMPPGDFHASEILAWVEDYVIKSID
ncbi:MAG TPA: TetR/AcrR family transcriptional regulator [Spirochaetota bacterium]|nr:TetR/AcrR family transcriptional regulator [Spirochaetota bacterium]HRZ25707.1 TetR/AcrR family transcriptional regulator [Spirochaetota bacterium]HSA14237.1 TetR/AcrR family transcriptional regulator [Spirochaetota bacterium]